MKKTWIAVLLLGLLLCLTACANAGTSKDSVTLFNVEYPLDITELSLQGQEGPDVTQIARLQRLTRLDLRGTGITTEEYDSLHQALPACRILWSVPFQGEYLDNTSQSLTLHTLSEDDVNLLDYLTGLTTVDATDCRDVEALYDLQQRHPDCRVDYSLTVRGVRCPLDSREVSLPTVDSQDMVLLCRHIPGLETLKLTEIQQNPAGLLDMMEAYPEITFLWDTELYGVTVNSQADFLDFSDATIDDPEALENLIIRLPNLTQVDMCRCGISNEDMDAMNRRHDSIKFVWEIDFGKAQYRTDITWFMPCQQDLWLTDSNCGLLNYFTDLECLDLGHHHLTTCSYVANMPKLRYLLLGDMFITDLTPLEGLENVVYLEIFMTYVTDYTPILTLKNLEVLNLSYTQGDPDVVAQMTWVDYIRWVNYEDRSISFARKEQLRQELPDTLLELEIATSSTGGMWRQTQHYFDMRDLVQMPYFVG